MQREGLVTRSQGREEDDLGLGPRRQGVGLAVSCRWCQLPVFLNSCPALQSTIQQLQDLKPRDCQSSTKAYLVDKSTIHSLP